MTSPLATADLDDLRAAGLSPTDEDVIRLHALACRISNGPETTAANVPRWAVAGGVTFWEPTLAARFFFEYARKFADTADTEDWLFHFACAHGRDAGYLDALRDPADIQRELAVFLRSLTATKAEVERAVSFCITGYDDVVAEKTAIAKRREEERKARGETGDADENGLAALEDILEQAAAATGLGLNDILGQTPSRLCGMVYAAHIQAGMSLSRSSAKAHADYLATRAAIEKRLREEKAKKDNSHAQSHTSCATTSPQSI